MPEKSIIIETGSELYAGISKQRPGHLWEGYSETDNLIFPLQGKVRLIQNGEKEEFLPGVLIYLPPHGRRQFFTLTEWSGIWCHFDLKLCGGIRPEWGDRPLCRVQKLEHADHRRIHAVLLQLLREVGQRRRGWRQLTYLLISEILLRCNIASETPLPPGRIQLAAKLLSQLQNPLPIDEIAAQCGMSHATFYRKFKESFAMSPHCYRENEMMRQAKYWLERSDVTLNDLSKKLGCSSSFYLSNRFKQWYGVSPSQYRQDFQTRRNAVKKTVTDPQEDGWSVPER